MKINTAEQGSVEWKKARAGVVTASMFHTATQKLKVGAKKGEPTEAAHDYAFRLAIERISCEPIDESFETWAMARGRELEAEARSAHEWHAGVIVDPCGFICTDDGLFGASADGLIGDDGGAEYKCLVSPARLRKALMLNDTHEFMFQVQGGMWITGRSWWDFCIYTPFLESIGKELTRWRIKRDDEFIKQMELDLIEFSKLVDKYEYDLMFGELNRR